MGKPQVFTQGGHCIFFFVLVLVFLFFLYRSTLGIRTKGDHQNNTMVRIKVNPEKSLYEVDYTHPSVILWFFGGQVPTKGNSKTQHLRVGIASATSSTQNGKDKDYKDKKPLKVGGGLVKVRYDRSYAHAIIDR